MRRSLGMFAVAVLLGAGLWLLPSASAGGAGGHGDWDVIRVDVHQVDSADLDLGDPGFGLGDRFVFTEDLLRHGKKVGTDHGECVLTRFRGERGFFQCSATAVFHGKGQITVQGVFSFNEEDEQRPFVLAVTGGTGKFRDAGGVVVVDETGPRSTLTFKLDR